MTTDRALEADLARAGAHVAWDVKQARIVLAYDEPMVCRLLVSLLQRRGFRNLLSVESGTAVIERLKEYKQDLLLLDMQMPDLSGVEVCKRVRTLKEFVDVPVLIQTATVSREEMGQHFADGVSDFLSKPINPTELIARVTLHLERRLLLGEMRSYR